MAFGLIDTSFIDFPANVDNAYLRGLQLRSGINFTEMASRVDAALAAVNAGVDPLIASLLAPPTTSATAPGGRNGTMTVTKKSQYTPARPQLVETTGHMLAIDELDIALGFTEDGLNEISLDNFQAQVDAMRDALELAMRRDVLYRLFTDAEIPIDLNATATSPGFAGSGTGANVFAAVYPDGTPLEGNYTHYYRDATANRAAVVKAARSRLLKWGGDTVELIGSQTSIDALVALGDFVYAGSPLVRVGSGSAEAVVDPMTYIGVYDKNILVRKPLTDFTEDHYALFRSNGQFAAGNPLVPRYDELRGFAAYVRSRDQFPLAQSNAMWKYGVNVNNRVGAALIKIASSGSYSAPSITY